MLRLMFALFLLSKKAATKLLGLSDRLFTVAITDPEEGNFPHCKVVLFYVLCSYCMQLHIACYCQLHV